MGENRSFSLAFILSIFSIIIVAYVVKIFEGIMELQNR